jgi:hypothetical protein
VEFEELRLQTQHRLIEFLRADLELARTFVDLARQYLKKGDHEGYDRLLRKTRRAIETVHRFEEKISDLKVRAELQHELEELERLLFSNE